MSGTVENSDILHAINQVVKAINDKEISVTAGSGSGGCGCSGVGGGVGIGAGDSTGSIIDVPPSSGTGGLDPDADPPPDGFDSWSEYYAYKCKAANALFDACLGWFRFLGGLNTALVSTITGAAFGSWILSEIAAISAAATLAALPTEIAAAVSIGFLATAPGWVLVAAVALIAVVVALVGVIVLREFDSLADEFENKRQDVVCGLFSAQDPDEAGSVLSTALGDSIISFVIENDTFEAEIRAMASGVVSYMLPYSFLNQLFEESTVVNLYTGATINCEEVCFCQFTNYFYTIAGATGTLIEHDEEAKTIEVQTGAASGGVYRFDFAFRDSEDEEEGDPTVFCRNYIRFVSQSGISDQGAPEIYTIADNTGLTYNDDSPWDGWISCEAFSVRSATNGSVKFEYSRVNPDV